MEELDLQNLNIDEFEHKDTEILGQMLKQILIRQRRMEERQRNLEDTVSQISEKFDDVELHKVENGDPILEKDTYPDHMINSFWAELQSSSLDKEGVAWRDIKKIFSVKKSQAYDLMEEINSDYDKVGKIERSGNQPSILVDKKNYLQAVIEEDYPTLLDSMKEKTGKIISNFTWEELMEAYEQNVQKHQVDEKVERLEKLKDAFNY